MKQWLPLSSILPFARPGNAPPEPGNGLKAGNERAPSVPFTPDADTAGLYHFNEGSGTPHP